MPTDKDIEKGLRDLGRREVPYPKDLRTGTRAEFVTRVKTNQPKGPGCPLLGGTLVLVVGLVVYLLTVLL